MRNQPTSLFDDSRAPRPAAESAWRTDASPTARLAWLFALMLLPLIAVGARLGELQAVIGERFVEALDRTTIAHEPIPSRDGRLLSADGQVLAFDVERFEIRAHYRWIEDPPDERWLRQQAQQRLTRTERRDAERMAGAKAEILAERDRMWSRLSELAGTPTADLATRRRDVQRRVERIVASVESRQADAAGESPPDDATAAGGPWWRTAWETVVETVTTPPRRERDDPVVVREELDYHPLLDGVSLEVAAEIEANPTVFPALRIEVSTRRQYPAGPLAAHVVGTRTPLAEDECEARRTAHPHGDPLDYRPGDRIGRSGVERAYDRHLHGLPGVRRIERNRQGIVVRTDVVRPPRVGRDLVLTIDRALQSQAEAILDETLAAIATPTHADDESASPAEARRDPPRGGCVVALDVHTGAVLAAASAPRFDLQQSLEPDPAAWRTLVDDPRRPFFPRATRMTLAPGSTFKTLTAVALLESGRFDPDEQFACQGYLDQPNRHRCYVYQHFGVGHGDVDLAKALCQSCNVYFFDAARKIGPEPIVDWARRFGFGQPTGIDLPGELGGQLPSPDALAADGRRVPWYPGNTLGLAIGQANLSVTPLQIARMMAAVANGGRLVTPHVVRGTSVVDGHDDGERVAAYRPPRPIPGLTDAALVRVREGLRMVVEHPQGTAYKTVRLPQVPIAGKTGTAEVGGGLPDHAWFAGYVPADRPRIAFVVVLEHAGSGGKAAGPPARRLVEALLDVGLLEPLRLSQRD